MPALSNEDAVLEALAVGWVDRRSPRRAMLEWIVSAKRPETRAARIRLVAEAAARNERAR